MMNQVVIKCNLCGKKKFKIVHNQDESQILKCQNCDLIFRSPLPKETEIKKFYNKDKILVNKYFEGLKKDYDLKNPAIKLYQNELDKLSKVMKPGRLLDIGCAYGAFLDLARKYNWQVSGVEVSEKSSKYAKKTFNLPIYNGTLERAKFASNTYNLVTMWDLIEHLTDPLSTLKETKRILKDNGMILILTINTDSLIGKLANLSSSSKDYLYDKQHNFFFTHNTLKKMVEKAGFKDVQKFDSFGAQISRWQSRKVPTPMYLAVNMLDIIARLLNFEYRQVIIAKK